MVTVVTMVADRVKSGYHGCRELRVVYHGHSGYYGCRELRVVTMVADRVKSGYHGCRELRVVTMVAES